MNRFVNPCADDVPVAEVRLRTAPEISQIPVARRVLRAVAEPCREEEREALLVVATELLSNAVAHAVTCMELRVELHPAYVRLNVIDDGDGRPGLRAVAPLADRGRGLHIVDRLSAAWGVEDLIPGKQVWSVIARGEDNPLAARWWEPLPVRQAV